MSASSPDPAVDVSGLVKRFGSTTAVDGSGPAARRAGRCSRCSGPNGAGKTTTSRSARASCAATPVRCGCSASIPATDARAAAPAHRRDAAGRRRLPGRARGGDARARRGLRGAPARPGVADRGARPRRRRGGRRTSGSPAGSSSGCRWRARWSAARSWCSSTSRPPGMDPQARRLVWELVRALRARRRDACCSPRTLMEEAEELADQVVIIDRGRVVARGHARASSTAEQPDAAQLRFRAPGGHGPDASCARRCPTDCRIERADAGRVPAAGRRSTRRWCPRSPRGARSRACSPRSCTWARRSLEDVFLELTGRELR